MERLCLSFCTKQIHTLSGRIAQTCIWKRSLISLLTKGSSSIEFVLLIFALLTLVDANHDFTLWLGATRPQSRTKRKPNPHCTSEHHSSLIALSETTRRAIFPSDFVHNAVITPSAEITMVACWAKGGDRQCTQFEQRLILKHVRRRRGHIMRRNMMRGSWLSTWSLLDTKAALWGGV